MPLHTFSFVIVYFIGVCSLSSDEEQNSFIHRFGLESQRYFDVVKIAQSIFPQDSNSFQLLPKRNPRIFIKFRNATDIVNNVDVL